MEYRLNKLYACPILMYTSIIPVDNDNTSFCTTCDKFESDMHKIIEHGYEPISLKEAYKGFSEEKHWTKKPICIIFVGGYENNYTLAFPIIKKMNIPVSIFVATDLVGVHEYANIQNFIPHFDWIQANEMQNSGLIDIFPMWHTFDQGKPISDAMNKALLIGQHISKSEPSFAISYKNCTYDEMCALNDMGFCICISDCLHITGEMMSKGVLPSIYVDHTSDVLDVISQYHEICKDALEKEAASLNTVKYIEPSFDVLADSVTLSIDNKPIVRNYLRHAFALSILQTGNKERAERLVLSEYIDVIYKPWDNWFDYHNHLYNVWDCFEYKRMTYDILAENRINIIEYIIHALKIGYYCDAWLDTYYIPGKPGYNRAHMTHGILIFSYLSETREFKAVSYNAKGLYDELLIPIKSVFMACSNRYFDYINLIKENKNSLIKYDIIDLYKKLSDYVNSICHDDNKRFSKKSAEQYYNFDASKKYIENFHNTVIQDGYIHLTSLYSFAEQKRIMMWRIKYITDKEKLPFSFDEIYFSAVRLTEKLVNLGLKYNLSKRYSICCSMVNIMHELCGIEKKYIECLLSALSNKLFNQE